MNETDEKSSEESDTAEEAPPRKHGKLNLIFGIVMLGLLLTVVLNLGDTKKFGQLLAESNPAWLAIGLLYQIGTYLCAATVWHRVLRRFKVEVPFRSLISLGLAKLFIDQVVPTTGIGGTIVVIQGLERRGAPRGIAAAAPMVDMVGYYAAHVIALAISLVILLNHGGLHPVILVAAAVFTVIAVVIPVAIIKLTRRDKGSHAGWVERIGPLRRLLDALAEAPAETFSDWRLLAQIIGLQLMIHLLDAATLDAMFRALGQHPALGSIFASYTIAAAVTTVSVVPGGLGFFEASSIAMLRLLDIPIETGTAATLMLRVLMLWLPMIPGLWIARHEQKKLAKHAEAPSPAST